MPHGTIEIGDLAVTALCDAEAPFPRPLAEAFPKVEAARWAAVRRAHPEAFDGEDGWYFHVHCYLVRAGDRLVLVDTGIGAATTSASEWLGVAGRLPTELHAAGVSPGDVDVVVLTHLHLDHIGWSLREGADGRLAPTFSNARYLVQRAEWEGFAAAGDEGDRAALDELAAPLAALGALELLEGEREVAPGVRAVPAPGHTPGHQVVVAGDGGGQVLLAGDLAVHVGQLLDPSLAYAADLDPAAAAATRRRWLDRAEAGGAAVAIAHHPAPFGVLRRIDGARRYEGGEGA